jgi:tRNA (adenine57-N1/adenine58-N1)-methyltransferase catalytic subunit
MRVFSTGETTLVILGRKRFLMRLQAGQLQHTHHGLIRHDEIIGQAPGKQLTTHLGYPLVVLRPSLHDIIMSIERISQIVYPKEIGYVLLKLNVGPGSQIVEGGTGSGALTIAMAHTVRPAGRVYTYEQRDDMQRVARKNLTDAGLLDWVDLKQRDIAAGFDERDMDAVFLDVREPWLYLSQTWEALGEGGFFGALVPTTNQVSDLVAGLDQGHFTDIEVCEILLRSYKPVPARLRPTDRMVAHTGYLVFARRLEKAVAIHAEQGDRPDPGPEEG